MKFKDNDKVALGNKQWHQCGSKVHGTVAWPAGSVSIIGAAGPQGVKGTQGVVGTTGPQGTAGSNGQILIAGNAALSGAGDPGSGVGNDGVFYINTTNDTVSKF
jgi:hypothetical protein